MDATFRHHVGVLYHNNINNIIMCEIDYVQYSMMIKNDKQQQIRRMMMSVVTRTCILFNFGIYTKPYKGTVVSSSPPKKDETKTII